MSSFYLGKRLSTKGQRCTVRYIGPVAGKQGQWLGVEWDDATRGKHSGTHQGVEYFKCRTTQPTAASFLRPSTTWDKPRTFLQALKQKYAATEIGGQVSSSSSSSSSTTATTTASQVIRISGKAAEEVGFEKIARQQAQLQTLHIVVLDNMLIEAYDDKTSKSTAASVSGEQDGLDQISTTCPNIIELDLGRNLFETLDGISDICARLPKLKFLRLDGNRLSLVPGAPISASGLSQIISASLNHMLCTGPELETILHHLPNIKELSASNNQLSSLEDCSLPETLTSLTLQDNNFTSLQDLQALTQSCPRLTTLNLGNNKITSTYSETSSTQHDHPFTLPKTTTTLDISFNDIKTWHPINTLPLILPCLHHLRITQNPIFFTTTAPSSAVAEPPTLLSPSDVYILMIARLPSTLKTLNYTAITEKDRVNAEVYYLSQIAKELSLLLPEEKKRQKDVLKHHPRWKELCQEYGVPSVQSRARDENNVDPTTLAAKLVSCLVYPSTATTTTTDNTDSNNKQQQQQEEKVIMEIPKSTTTYKLHGIIARHLSLPPTCLRLILETGEQERVNMATWNGVEEWDSSDEEEEEEEETTEKKRKEWKQREEELVGGTRTLGTFVDGREARIRVEMK